MEIRGDERVIVLGKTGSGKTFFCQHLLTPQKVPRLIVCDPKGRISKEEWHLEDYTKERYRDLARGKPVRLRIPSTLINNEDDWEEWFARFYRLRNVIIQIDELYGVGPEQGSEGLRALYTRGRELGIGVWSCAQRPTRIPIYALSEAEWFVMFQLRNEDDYIKMSKYMGSSVLEPLYDHQFYLYNDQFRRAVWYERLEVTNG